MITNRRWLVVSLLVRNCHGVCSGHLRDLVWQGSSALELLECHFAIGVQPKIRVDSYINHGRLSFGISLLTKPMVPFGPTASSDILIISPPDRRAISPKMPPSLMLPVVSFSSAAFGPNHKRKSCEKI